MSGTFSKGDCNLSLSWRFSLTDGARRVAVGAFAVLVAACATPSGREPALVSLQVAPDEEEAEFETVGDPFENARACAAYLTQLVPLFSPPVYEVARGPYPVEENDVRIHAISTRTGEFHVTEYRCLGSAIEARSWSAGASSFETEPFTLEDIQELTFPSDEGS